MFIFWIDRPRCINVRRVDKLSSSLCAFSLFLPKQFYKLRASSLPLRQDGGRSDRFRLGLGIGIGIGLGLLCCLVPERPRQATLSYIQRNAANFDRL